VAHEAGKFLGVAPRFTYHWELSGPMAAWLDFILRWHHVVAGAYMKMVPKGADSARAIVDGYETIFKTKEAQTFLFRIVELSELVVLAVLGGAVVVHADDEAADKLEIATETLESVSQPEQPKVGRQDEPADKVGVPQGAKQRGPKPRLEEYRRAAEVVARAVPEGENWRKSQAVVSEALDEAKIPVPSTWKDKNWRTWDDCDDLGVWVKVIEYRLRRAKE
jgi:hypothetical protein